MKMNNNFFVRKTHHDLRRVILGLEEKVVKLQQDNKVLVKIIEKLSKKLNEGVDKK